ncbi:MAG: LysM peptidoglycan-binding domain-containing protein [Puniceicoccales bacterium]|nr:LysM peptidoglycan-binding domain-containing protein [Puniceicoccales bacterium]
MKNVRFFLICQIYTAIFLLLAGCRENPLALSTTSETSDRNFIRAVECVRNEAYDDAIAYLNSVIESRKIAPESSLLQGTIYLDKKNDPISAIYFLRKYVRESGDAGQKKIAEQLIDTAKKEFLKTLPAYNGVGRSEAELIEVARTLKNQNTVLQNQMAMYRQKISDCEAKISILLSRGNFEQATIDTKNKNITLHVVQDGETLSSISSKFYGTPHAWQKIFEANNSLLKDPKDLKAGQKLLIP